MAATDKYPVGTQFGEWTVVGNAPRKKLVSGKFKSQLLCACRCGKTKPVQINNLIKGTSNRCVDCAYKRKANAQRLPANRDGVVNKKQCYKSYARGAKKRQLPFMLTFHEFLNLVAQNCHYCDTPPKNCYNLKYGKNHALAGQPKAGEAFIHSGIDRVNPAAGYSVENCVPCCRRCNVAKSDMPVDVFKAWIIRAYKHITKETNNGASIPSRNKFCPKIRRNTSRLHRNT